MKEFIIDFYINSNEMSLEKIKLLNDILFAKNLQNSNSKTINMGKNRYLSYNEKLPLTTFILEVNTLIEYIFERHKQTDWFNAENYTNSVLKIVELYNTENFKTKSVPLSNLALERTRNIQRAIDNDYIAGALNKVEIDRQRKKGIYVENGEIYNSNNEKLYVLNFTSAMNNILDKNKNREKKQGKGPNFYEVFKPTYSRTQSQLGAFVVFHANHFFLDLNNKAIEDIFSTLTYVSLVLFKETITNQNHNLNKINLEKRISKKMIHLNDFLKQITNQDCINYRSNLIDNILKKYNA